MAWQLHHPQRWQLGQIEVPIWQVNEDRKAGADNQTKSITTFTSS
jgi:hypothetical protein